MQERINHFFDFDIAPEVYSSLIVISLLIILCFVIFILAKRADPLKRPRGLLLLVEWAVEKMDGFVAETMGPAFAGFGGYFLAIASYLFLAFVFGLTGFPSPIAYIACPLSLSIIMFSLIHMTSIRYTKWRYFKRYVEPIAIFLPINLLSMWAPLLSTCLRLFGNALAGWVLMTLIYWSLGNLSSALFASAGAASGIFVAPFITPILHCYFDLFAGAIQTLVFCYLSALFIAQERPEDEDLSNAQISTQKASL